MQVYNIGWVGIPIGVYFLAKNYYLHAGELYLLIYAILLLISTLLPGWVMQSTYLILVTAMSFHMLSISKEVLSSNTSKKFNAFFRLIFQLEEEFTVFVYGLSLWLFLRIYTDKSKDFGIGFQYEGSRTFHGVQGSLEGWNCTRVEFVWIPLLWVLINLMSWFMGTSIIRLEHGKDNLYKEFALKYKVVPDLVFSLIIFAYNSSSYVNASTLFDCVEQWQKGWIMKISEFMGFSFSTLYFFWVKRGVFSIDNNESTSEKAQNQD